MYLVVAMVLILGFLHYVFDLLVSLLENVGLESGYVELCCSTFVVTRRCTGRRVHHLINVKAVEDVGDHDSALLVLISVHSTAHPVVELIDERSVKLQAAVEVPLTKGCLYQRQVISFELLPARDLVESLQLLDCAMTYSGQLVFFATSFDLLESLRAKHIRLQRLGGPKATVRHERTVASAAIADAAHLLV